jgi:hypothetical protein
LVCLVAVNSDVIAADAAVYYPLQPGKVYSYEVRMEAGNSFKKDNTTINITNNIIPSVEIKGFKSFPIVSQKPNGKIVNYFAVNNEGVFRIAKKSDNDPAIVIFDNLDFIIKNPVQVGNAWTGKDHSRLQIVSVSESVTVPAGRFDNCVKIKVERVATSVDPFSRKGDIADNTEYLTLAPDVGLVKHEAIQKMANGNFQASTLTLTSYR